MDYDPRDKFTYKSGDLKLVKVGEGPLLIDPADLERKPVLPSDWHPVILMPGVSPELPGLYEWRIEGVGCYIGQYTHVRRPTREYRMNVQRILAGAPYRKGNPEGFRQVHRVLADAVTRRNDISLTLLENQVAKADRNRRERELIAERRAQAERGGLPVLNSN